MAIILRITSADGKKVMTKALPALPANVKVPAGARADVIDPETKQETTLARWINDHSADRQRARGDHPEQGRDYVRVETTDWDTAEAWFAALPASPDAPRTQSDNWYASSKGEEPTEVAGLDLQTVLIGTAVGGAAAFGVYELTKGSKTKDKIAPAAPSGLDLAADDDTGTLTTDNITTKTTGLTISGTAEAGSRVELFDGTTSLGTVTAGANGAFTKDVDLAAGPHAITARATDLAGNVSEPATPIVVQVDTTAPSAPNTLVLATADDTGSSQTDGVTNRTSALTITGRADAGSVVELFDGTTSLGTATAAADGSFTRDISLTEGIHQITARSTDTAGNAGAVSTAIQITVDVTLPLAPTGLDLSAEDDNGSSNSDNVTSTKSGLTITGSAEPGSVVSLFDSTSPLGAVVAGSNGIFSFEATLAVGVHSITAKANDLAGNLSPSSAGISITIVQSPTEAVFPSASLSEIVTLSDVSHSGLVIDTTTQSFG